MKIKRMLSLRMSGEDVSYLQNRLKELGFFNERIDGVFGQNTLIAVVNFQKKCNIKTDGVVGSLTWNKLMTYDSSPILKSDIPHKISYTNINGLVIYDHLLKEEEYIKEVKAKNTIWLHHTAGGSRPDWTIDGWENDFKKDKTGKPILDEMGNKIPLQVGTPYVIGRKSSSSNDTLWDGKILRAFDDKYYAYHLGINSRNSEELNYCSIPIEICNYGPLTKGRDGKFYNYVYKQINDSDVVKLDKPFNGYQYFERYTDAQLESTRKLLVYLINKYAIKIEGKIYNEKWFDYDEKWFNPGGLRSHSQVRRDKFDIFPQKEMIQMLNSL